MPLNCTLVDIDSMLYTSIQGTYFYQVIFGTKFKFSENQSTLRFHYPYWAPAILLSQGIMALAYPYWAPSILLSQGIMALAMRLAAKVLLPGTGWVAFK